MCCTREKKIHYKYLLITRFIYDSRSNNRYTVRDAHNQDFVKKSFSIAYSQTVGEKNENFIRYTVIIVVGIYVRI